MARTSRCGWFLLVPGERVSYPRYGLGVYPQSYPGRWRPERPVLLLLWKQQGVPPGRNKGQVVGSHPPPATGAMMDPMWTTFVDKFWIALTNAYQKQTGTFRLPNDDVIDFLSQSGMVYHVHVDRAWSYLWWLQAVLFRDSTRPRVGILCGP